MTPLQAKRLTAWAHERYGYGLVIRELVVLPEDDHALVLCTNRRCSTVREFSRRALVSAYEGLWQEELPALQSRA